MPLWPTAMIRCILICLKYWYNKMVTSRSTSHHDYSSSRQTRWLKIHLQTEARTLSPCLIRKYKNFIEVSDDAVILGKHMLPAIVLQPLEILMVICMCYIMMCGSQAGTWMIPGDTWSDIWEHLPINTGNIQISKGRHNMIDMMVFYLNESFPIEEWINEEISCVGNG